MEERVNRVTRRTFVRLAAGGAALAAAPLAGPRPARAQRKRGGTLKVLHTEPAVGFHPAIEGTNWPECLRMVYNGLTDYDTNTQIVPGLAKSWTVSKNADVFTFQLHPGVTFHDGKECTSADVKFTYEQVLDPKVASSLATFLPNLKSVETPDKLTVVFRFDGPNVLFLPSVSPIGIVPRHLWADTDPRSSKYLSAPVGTGPFTLKEWQRSDHLTYVANRNYFRKPRPYVDEVIFRVMPDSATGMEAFKNGELDVAFGKMPGGQPFSQIKTIQETRADTIVASPYSQNLVQFLWMNCSQPPFNNVKVRRALAHAINKDFIVKSLLQGFGKVEESFIADIPTTKWAHDASLKPYEYSVAKANQLLDEAGFPRKGGTRFTISILATEGFRVKLSEAIKAMLQPVGITANIQSYTWGAYYDRMANKRDTGAALWTVFISRQMDPAHIADYLSERSMKAGGNNYGMWAHPEATKLIESARSSSIPETRKQLYVQAQKIVHDEVPILPLYSPVGVDFWYKYVEGLHSIDTVTGGPQFIEDASLNR